MPGNFYSRTKTPQARAEAQEESKYIIPSRILVSYNILETFFTTKNKFRAYIKSKIRGGGVGDPSLAIDMIGLIVDLYLLLKDYSDLTKKVEHFEEFHDKFAERIKTCDLSLTYEEIVVAVNLLFTAVYECGLTKIEVDQMGWEEQLRTNF